MIWPDEFLLYDPFGYYIPKPIAGNNPDPNFIYMEDYPINDSKWDRANLEYTENLEDEA